MKKAFTIIELLVAMGLLSMLIAISGLVFSTAVKAHRIANATGEISAKLQAFTQQLDADFGNGHLQKDGEFLLVWAPSPELKRDGTILDEDGDGIPDRYLSFDRVMFFAGGDFQSYDAQPADTNGDGTVDSSKIVYSNMARVCYIFSKDTQNARAYNEPNPVKRMLCRTQHLITADTDLPTFPDITAWDQTKSDNFHRDNFLYEYQTMTREDWLNIPLGNPTPIKDDILSIILDLRVGSSTILQGGPKINLNDAGTLHQLFMQGVGQFHVQIWKLDSAINRYRWWPEIDPDGDGIYNEGSTFDDGRTDYLLNGNEIDTVTLDGRLVPHWHTWDHIGPALKFTFTLYDSNGVFKDGKTFTYIVNLQ